MPSDNSHILTKLIKSCAVNFTRWRYRQKLHGKQSTEHTVLDMCEWAAVRVYKIAIKSNQNKMYSIAETLLSWGILKTIPVKYFVPHLGLVFYTDSAALISAVTEGCSPTARPSRNIKSQSLGWNDLCHFTVWQKTRAWLTAHKTYLPATAGSKDCSHFFQATRIIVVTIARMKLLVQGVALTTFCPMLNTFPLLMLPRPLNKMQKRQNHFCSFFHFSSVWTPTTPKCLHNLWAWLRCCQSA